MSEGRQSASWPNPKARSLEHYAIENLLFLGYAVGATDRSLTEIGDKGFANGADKFQTVVTTTGLPGLSGDVVGGLPSPSLLKAQGLAAYGVELYCCRQTAITQAFPTPRLARGFSCCRFRFETEHLPERRRRHTNGTANTDARDIATPDRVIRRASGKPERRASRRPHRDGQLLFQGLFQVCRHHRVVAFHL